MAKSERSNKSTYAKPTQEEVPGYRFAGIQIPTWIVTPFSFKIPAWAKATEKPTYEGSKPYSNCNCFSPFQWLEWMFRFAGPWITSRPYGNFLLAVPALVVGCCVAVLMVQQWRDFHDWRGDLYRSQLNVAIRENDDELSRLILARLIHENPTQKEYRFQQAILDEKLGNDNLATQTMLSLAKKDVHLGAANWIIQKKFTLENLDKWTKGQHREFNEVMTILLDNTQGESEVKARTYMAKYLIASGAPNDAIKNLISAAGKNPELALTIANLYAQLREQQNKKQWAETAVQYYEKKLLSSPTDKVARIGLARSLLLAEREEEAAKRLAEGYKLTGDKELGVAGGEALAAWANRIKAQDVDSEENLLRRIKLLTQAIRVSPDSPLVNELLLQVAIECAESESSQVIEMRNAVMQKLDAESVHFIQGTIDLLHGESEKAKAHFQLASPKTKDLPGILNNMAVSLYQRDQPDLKQALEFANTAIQKLDHPYFRETRGQIYMRMKQHGRAILDFESALRAPDIAKTVHESLAQAYDAAGRKDLAEENRKKANAIKIGKK